MLRKTFSILGLLLFFLGAPFSPAHAQAVFVTSLVNGEPITSLDIAERVKFLSFSTGQPITEQNKAQFERDVLEILIDEKLKFQTAKQFDPGIVARAQTHARQLVDDTFGSEAKSASALLKENNISFQVALNKATSDLVWSSVLQRTFPRQFEAIEKMVDEELSRLEDSLSEPQVHLLEIVLLPNDKLPLANTMELANQIVEAIRNGADFRNIAQQYSASSSAKAGGDIGWAQMQRLPTSFIEQLQAAEMGAVLDPIILDGIIYVLKKNGFRQEGLMDASLFEISMSRAIFPMQDDASEDTIDEMRKNVLLQTSAVKTCAGMRALNDRAGSGAESDLKDLMLGDINPEFAKIVTNLEAGEKTEPILFAEGFTVIMLCSKKAPVVTLPSRAEIEQSELDSLFSALSGRYLIRLRRSSVIEIRGQ